VQNEGHRALRSPGGKRRHHPCAPPLPKLWGWQKKKAWRVLQNQEGGSHVKKLQLRAQVTSSAPE